MKLCDRCGVDSDVETVTGAVFNTSSKNTPHNRVEFQGDLCPVCCDLAIEAVKNAIKGPTPPAGRSPTPDSPVKITWRDAAGWHHWTDVDEFKEQEPQRSKLTNESVGWVICEDDLSVTIAGHRSDQNAIDGIMRIPKCCIMSRVLL